MSIFDLLRSGLFVLAHVFGGSFGAAIVVASIVLRVAMLPITLPAARRRIVRERKLQALAPQLTALRERFAKNPQRLAAAINELYAREGISLVDRRTVLDMLYQLPPGALLYSAISRAGSQAGGLLWISNLATPDRVLALVAGVVSAGIAWIAARSPEASQAARVLPVVIGGAITYLFLSHISAGVALYSLTSSVAAGVENAIARRTLDRKRV